MNGIEIGGGSKVQGPVFRPRKTRLGRIVKYNSKSSSQGRRS
jgi:hypothetical protein